MSISNLESCCSVLEVHSLYGNVTAEEIKEELVEHISNYYNDYENRLDDPPTYLIATTKDREQPQAVKALKELGFTPKKFYGRHQGVGKKRVKYMTFWSRSSLPRGVRTAAKKLAKENGGHKRSFW